MILLIALHKYVTSYDYFFHTCDYLYNMKRNLLTLITILLLSVSMHAQDCTERAFGFGNNNFIVSYNVSGDVDVVYDAANEQVTLNLGSNYSTAFGPDVRAYLVQSNGISDDDLTRTRIRDLENVEFGLTVANGTQTFTIPAPPSIERYDKVFFYCLQFDQFWDFGTIVPFPEGGCVLSSVNDNIANEAIDIFPNPTSEYVNITTNQSTAVGQVLIYNVIGKLVYSQESAINTRVDISRLDDGVYTLQTQYNGKVSTKKLVVQK